MDYPLKVCVIGCGDMGSQHAKAWNARDDSEVVAVFDPIEERANALSKEIGAQAYGTYQEAIENDQVAAVSVATPTCFHAEIAVFAASRGRHVLCEKPLAARLEDAEAMIRTAQKNNVLLGTSLQVRDFGHHRRLKEVVDSGRFGAPLFVRFVDLRDVRPKPAMHRRSMNNGPVLDMACHYFDFMRYLARSEPASVFATGHVFGKGKAKLAGIDDLAIDAADIQVRYENGHVLSAYINWGMPEGCENITTELYASPVSVAHTYDGKLKIAAGGAEETVEMEFKGPVDRIDNFARAVQGQALLEIKGEDGLVALKVSLAAFESIETGRAVNVEQG